MTLAPGTFVEVFWTKAVSEICIVEAEEPLKLRPATAWERLAHVFRKHKAEPEEFSAAVDAIRLIEAAKSNKEKA